ncbi:YadA-like family protein [Azonexus sp. IMCC34839]|uniref:YadA-like family protein n=1 Tax=Azonexus sp. IMCC34839 TaxID=3133695 RepID=UPI00399AB836
MKKNLLSALVLAALASLANAQVNTVEVSSPSFGSTPATASADNAIAIGAASVAGTNQSGGTPALVISPLWSYSNQVAIGTNSLSWGAGDTAVGTGAIAVSQPAPGTNAAATSYGYGATSWGNNSVAIGAKATAGGGAAGTAPTSNPTISNATAIGATANAAANNSTAVGTGSQALATGSVALGAGSTATRANSVEVGGRQVTGVAAGTQATDAVNFGQLQAAIAGVGGVDAGAILNQANAYTDQAINAVRREYSQAIAAVAASPALPSLAPGERAIAVGGGFYNGQQAIGVTFGQALSNGALVNAGVATAGAGRPVARVGAAWKF